jgi:hypothetical protein
MGNNKGWMSALKFFAELGDLLVRYAAQPAYAIAMIIVGWVLWPIGALIASLLIASLYYHATQPLAPSTPSTTPEAPPVRPAERGWVSLAGLVLMGVGMIWLMREMFMPHISFAFVLIALGFFLIVFGIVRQGRAQP